MVGRYCVRVPVGINLVPDTGSGDVRRVLLFIIAMERAIKTVTTLNGDMPLYATELARGAMVVASITAAAAVSTIAVVTATNSLIPSGLSALVVVTRLLVGVVGGVTGAAVGEAGGRVGSNQDIGVVLLMTLLVTGKQRTCPQQ